jgi:L-amino acid ligase C-terminal domain 2
MKKIIVTNTGDLALSRQLLADPDLDVLVVTEHRFADQYPDGTRIAFVDSLNDPATTVEQVLAQTDVSDRTHVISLSERAALAAGYLRSYLALPGASSETILRSTNKFTMKRRFVEVGLLTTDFRLAGNAAEVHAVIQQIGLPVVVKPAMGAGADATQLVSEPAELSAPPFQELLARLADPATTSEKAFPVVVERALPLTGEYHCDGLVRGGRVRYVRVSRYLSPILPVMASEARLYGSYTLPADDPIAVRIVAMHERAVEAVGLVDGVTHFEALEVGDQLFAGELASRPGGNGIRRMLQLRDGFDSKAAHVATSLAEPYSWQPAGGDTEIAQINLLARRGRVLEISTADDFAGIPGIIEVDMRHTPGDVVGGLMDSSSVSGIVYAHVPTPADVTALAAALGDAFRLKTELVAA